MQLSQVIETSPLTLRDTEVILQHILQVERPFLYTHQEFLLTHSQYNQWESICENRLKGEPVAYLIHSKHFYGRDYYVDASTLIPRPETEELVELALTWINSQSQPLRILELGTGSGCISISLACEASLSLNIMATDISSTALDVAKKNWGKLYTGTSIATFIQSDLFDHPDILAHKPYDVIIANLPYLPLSYATDGTMPQEVVCYEPNEALFAGTDGLELYSRFIDKAPQYLARQGAIFLECNYSHANALNQSATRSFPDKQVALHNDLSDKPRFITIT